MTKILCLAALLALGLTPVSAQPAQPPALSKFSLDFPGGSASQLVEAIEKAMGKPLNVIINKEDEDMALPPLKMNDVVMPQLFTALEATSRKVVAVSNPGNPGFSSYSQMVTSYGFKTDDNPVSDTSVWYFHVERPSLPPVVSTSKKICQFYPLLNYLDRGFTVDDITTAIQTGWKLSGETNLPELNYHKETKLLIAYGDPSQLVTIDHVLQALPGENSIHLRQQTDQMAAQIQKLQEEVDQLKNPPPGPGGNLGKTPFSEEKSGK